MPPIVKDIKYTYRHINMSSFILNGSKQIIKEIIIIDISAKKVIVKFSINKIVKTVVNKAPINPPKIILIFFALDFLKLFTINKIKESIKKFIKKIVSA